MTDAIPEDVMQAATKIADKYLGFEISCQRLYEDVAAAILSEREKSRKRVEELEAALRHIRSATYYPVSTLINPKGWAWHMAPDGQEFVVETIEGALLRKEGTDAR